ncbi:UDP-2,4-diacetamido-2,4,6-trideoxy-beta-L-altropyranose hydrolase [Spirosomataceae bacterium TFI 002]|nr:UDP-2,4-diacetamido-2,4,6-trideoxy-beta-L-altropyranose hydrolase [Spirosomataceae bacterium TFI 002]
MKTKPKIYFRADGNARIGLGHVTRSLALADMLKDDFDCYFIIQHPLPSLKEQILMACTGIIELNNNNGLIQEASKISGFINTGEIIVLDGYNFITAYQQVFKEKDIKVVCIDDIHACHFVADIIINHAGGVTQNEYSAEDYTQFYLGVQYALLSKVFREAAKNKVINKPNNLFICLGGADPKNDTLHILKKIEQKGEQNTCFLIIGAAYLHQDSLLEFIKSTKLKVELLINLSGEKMVFYMNQCARAITSPSTISYEYLSTGGLLYLKMTADNQNDINEYFLKEKLALSFDNFVEEYSSHQLEELAKGQSSLFDGKQQKRFLDIFYDSVITIRSVGLSDSTLYFDWVNDPSTRQQSYNIDPVSLEQHNAWFNQRLTDEKSVLYVVEFNKNPIGQIRFQIENCEAKISYSVDKIYRGKGFGFWILKRGIEAIRKSTANLKIIGYVKFENIASINIFRKLGFEEVVSTEMKNSYKYLLNY